MLISISKIKKQLGIKGVDLNSRDWGGDLKKEILKQIKELQPSDDTVNLDFAGIRSFNSSIADEVIVLLMKELLDGEREVFLVSKNIPENSLYDLELVTAYRKIPCLVIHGNKKHPVVVFGERKAKKKESHDLLIYDYIMATGKCTAREIADLIFKKDIYTASMYLGKLYKSRLIRRKELIDPQGKQFIYTPVV
jgi:STAS-like domain of unknown function (DUF4325)